MMYTICIGTHIATRTHPRTSRKKGNDVALRIRRKKGSIYLNVHSHTNTETRYTYIQKRRDFDDHEAENAEKRVNSLAEAEKERKNGRKESRRRSKL